MMSVSVKKSERLDKVLQAAGQLFARQGYHATSTREIARIADVSENTLFRHFDHKEDIFWAALRYRLTGLKLRREILDGIMEGQSPEVVLPMLFAQLVDTTIMNPELLRLVAVAFLELHWKAGTVCHEYLSPILTAIRSYLAKNMQQGKVRNLDPTMVTAALGMTVMAHPEIAKMIDGNPPTYSDSRDAIQAYSRFWLDVLVRRPAELLASPATTASQV